IQFQYQPMAFHSVFKKTSLNISNVKGTPCIVFCGIGTPSRFRALLSAMQVEVKEFFAFRDHHLYTGKDLENITRAFEKHSSEYIITTEKDAMRLSEDIVPNRISKYIYYLEIQVKTLKGEKELDSMLKSILNKGLA
ncbi:MAG: tetraacyldisaccharide 4'-kinase, partial [Bacteroidota bacterium]|nr:tetraacyldisaccharide 4'-kinase [Bacteroidota bacterium]